MLVKNLPAQIFTMARINAADITDATAHVLEEHAIIFRLNCLGFYEIAQTWEDFASYAPNALIFGSKRLNKAAVHRIIDDYEYINFLSS